MRRFDPGQPPAARRMHPFIKTTTKGEEMSSRKLALSPAPLLLAALVAAAFPALAAPPESKEQQAAVNPSPVKRIKLSTGIVDGKMVFLDEKGQANPVLKANVGDTIEITISSGEGAQHDIVFPDLNVASAKFDKSTGATKVRFKVTKAGSFEYYCSIAGHRQVGMEGVFEVSGPATAAAGAGKAPRPAGAKPLIDYSDTTPIQRALPAVSVAMDPNAVPAPIGKRAPETVKYRVETAELVGRLDDGTS